MNIWLYDHRETYGRGFSRELGDFSTWNLTATGTIHIKENQKLWALRVQLSSKDMGMLRQRLNDLHDKKEGKKSAVLRQVEQFLKDKS